MASLTCWLALVVVLLVDGSSARHTFVAVSSGLSGARIRRDTNTDNNVQDQTPKIKILQVDSIIKYRFANTVVFSKLQNRNNRSREISFTTVLPDSAFISGFAITINNEVYKAYVKEKEEAKRIYQSAVRSGKTAGHVELSARDSNQFTVSVNVEAFGKVSFNLTYEELLSRELGTYKHKINLNPRQIVKDMLVQVTIVDAYNITRLQVPDLQESNEITLEDNSVNNLATVERPNATSAIIRWVPTAQQQQNINQNGVKGIFEVRYDVDRSDRNSDLLVYEGYFVHFLAPESKALLPKHVVFVLDSSGSMGGRKIEQLKEAMNNILDELRNVDTFSLLHFSDIHEVWETNHYRFVNAKGRRGDFSSLVIVKATKENIEAAKTAVNGIRAMGATYMYDALHIALDLVKVGKNTAESNTHRREPTIIFLTDGEPNGPNSGIDTIISHTTANNRNPSAVIYSLGFGEGADMNLLKKLSIKNFGFARKIYEASDASIQLRHFFRQVASPQLSNVSIHFLEDQVDMSSLTKTQFHVHNSGSETVVAGRLNGVGNLTAEVTGQDAMGDVSIVPFPYIVDQDYLPRPPLMQNASSAGFMERMWAYLTIRQLLDVKDSAANETRKTRAMELALRYSFVTPLTSLVVVKPNETTSADPQAVQPSSDHQPPLHSTGIYSRFLVGHSDHQPPLHSTGIYSRFLVGHSESRSDMIQPAGLPWHRRHYLQWQRRRMRHKYGRPQIHVEPSTEPSRATVTTVSDVDHSTESSTTSVTNTSDVEHSTEPSSTTVTTISDVGSTPDLSTTTEIDISGTDDGITSGLTNTSDIDISDVQSTSESMTNTVGTLTGVDNAAESWTNPVSDISASALAKFNWFPSLSNETHITLLIDGVNQTFQIGYSEPDKAYSTCWVSQNVQGHCRHLPHCALDPFAQNINNFLQYYFCTIGNFIGACCPENHVTPEK